MSILPVGNRDNGWSAVAFLLTAGLLAAGCGSSAATGGPVTLRVGYFPNVTHAVALVGVRQGILAKDLGPDKLDAGQTFNAGPAETQALLSSAIDVAFVGPSPSIAAFTQSHGAVKIIAGAASGGAGLVTRAAITAVSQLKGKTLATPQLGNTQDVALRAYLKSKGLTTDLQGGGDVSIKPQSNSQTVTAFKLGTIDGAWVPEPYLSQLVAAGGHVLVDERTLWPGGRWDSTDVLVRTAFLRAHPATVKRFLQGVVDTIQSIRTDPATAQADAGKQLAALSAPLAPPVLAAAFSNVTFTADPIASSIRKQAADAVAAGTLTAPDLTGIFDLTLVNQVLESRGLPQVAAS